MSRSRLLLASTLLWLTTSALPAPVQAWTDARVTGLSAQVDVRKPETRIELSVQVRVAAGFLSRFELLGLDSGFALAPDAPPVFEAATGERYTPAVTTPEPTTVVLRFENKHTAPRRGDYTLHVSYLTPMPLRAADKLDARTLRVRVGLPSWDVGLSNVRVVVLSPHGSRPAADGGDALGEAQVQDLDQATTQIELTRPQLMRGQIFEAVLDAPASAYPSAPSATAGTAQLHPPTRSTEGRPAWLLTLLFTSLGLVALAKRKLVRVDAAKADLHVIPLFGVPGGVTRTVVVLAAAAASGFLFESASLLSTLLAVVSITFALDRGFRRGEAPDDRVFRDVTRADFGFRTRELSRLTGPAAWLDATTPIGATLLALVHGAWLVLVATGGASRDPQLVDLAVCAACLVSVLFVTATRASQPDSCQRALGRLADLQQQLRSLRGLPATLQLVVHETPDGRIVSPRLRILPGRVPAGMGKLEITLAEDSFRGRPTRAFAWLAVSREGSPADALLAYALPDARRRPCTRKDRVTRTECISVSQDPATELPRLLAWLTRELEVPRAA